LGKHGRDFHISTQKSALYERIKQSNDYNFGNGFSQVDEFAIFRKKS